MKVRCPPCIDRHCTFNAVGGNSDSRRQEGRDSEIAPTNEKKYFGNGITLNIILS